MSAGFTPGPWAVRAPMIQAVGRGERAGKVAEVSIAFKDTATFDANAYLIAAAPTMAGYIQRRAEAGDAEAQEIWEVACGRRP